jgi:outer membrane protein OmpA-like peptidoglycan-associated protein
VGAGLLLLAGCASSEPAYTGTAARDGSGGAYTPAPVREGSGGAYTPAPPREGSTDERVAAVEGRMNEMNQRLDRVSGQVQQMEGGVKAAQGRADEAAKKAETVDSRLTRLWTNRFNQKQADSLEVYFSPDSIDLSDAAQTALAAVVREMEAHPTLTVELGGYTDPKGALDYNYGLSQRRVDAVRRFLVDKGIALARIQSASLGPIKGGDISDAKKRRVTLRLMVDPE